MNINVTILGQAISFVIFVFFCMKYVWTPMISIIEKRQKEISDVFISAEESKKNSEKIRMEACDCLSQAKIEAQSIIEGANRYRAQLLDQAKCEVYAQREKILSQAYEVIAVERKCVVEELRKEIGLIVIAGVERIIECSIEKSFDSNIIDGIIDKLSMHNIK